MRRQRYRMIDVTNNSKFCSSSSLNIRHNEQKWNTRAFLLLFLLCPTSLWRFFGRELCLVKYRVFFHCCGCKTHVAPLCTVRCLTDTQPHIFIHVLFQPADCRSSPHSLASEDGGRFFGADMRVFPLPELKGQRRPAVGF